MRFTIEIPDELFQPNAPKTLAASAPESAAVQPIATSDARSGGAAPGGAGLATPLELGHEAISAGSAEETSTEAAPIRSGQGIVASDGGAAPR